MEQDKQHVHCAMARGCLRHFPVVQTRLSARGHGLRSPLSIAGMNFAESARIRSLRSRNAAHLSNRYILEPIMYSLVTSRQEDGREIYDLLGCPLPAKPRRSCTAKHRWKLQGGLWSPWPAASDICFGNCERAFKGGQESWDLVLVDCFFLEHRSLWRLLLSELSCRILYNYWDIG